jgi:hypothetical protein
LLLLYVAIFWLPLATPTGPLAADGTACSRRDRLQPTGPLAADGTACSRRDRLHPSGDLIGDKTTQVQPTSRHGHGPWRRGNGNELPGGSKKIFTHYINKEDVDLSVARECNIRSSHR